MEIYGSHPVRVVSSGVSRVWGLGFRVEGLELRV